MTLLDRRPQRQILVTERSQRCHLESVIMLMRALIHRLPVVIAGGARGGTAWSLEPQANAPGRTPST